MSLNLNHVVLAGNLTRDPELKFINQDRCVAHMGIATNRKWKDKAGNQQEEVTFVEVEAWGRTAELCGQYLVKGRPVYIEGRLKLDSWEKDGQKHSKLKVVADTVQFLGAKPEAAQAPAQAQTPARPTAPAGGGAGDDVPFSPRGEME